MKRPQSPQFCDRAGMAGEFAPRADRPWWQTGWFFFVLLAGATFLAYQPVWHGGFIWDDAVLVTSNPLIKDAGGWWRVWCEKYLDYVPATSSTFWLEWRCWGTNPLGYHLDNVLLHVVAAFVLWKVLERLQVPGARLAAGIFALHPVQVESVAWIAERKNTLAMVFYAGALLCFLRFDDTGRRRWYGLAAAAFVLAVLSKPVVAPLPVVLLGMAWWRRGRIQREDILRAVLFFALAAAACVLAIWIQRGAMSHTFPHAGPGLRLARASWAFWFYLGKILWPLNLSPVYSFWHIDPTKVASFLPLLALVAVFAAGWHYRNGWGRGVLAAFGYYLVLLLPALGLVDIAAMRFTPVADQWQYFATIGPIALAAAGLTRAGLSGQGRKLAWRVLCGALLAALGVLTWRQSRLYAEPATLWQAALKADPQSFLAHSSMGGILFRNGKSREAIAEYEKALKINPEFFDAHYDLGNILLATGHPSEAIAHYERVIQLEPGFAKAYNNLAWILATCPAASVRNGDRAVEFARLANQLSSSSVPGIIGTLAAAYAEAGRFTEAAASAQQALRLAVAANDQATADDLRRQLSLYQKGLPFRDPTQAGQSGKPPR